MTVGFLQVEFKLNLFDEHPLEAFLQYIEGNNIRQAHTWFSNGYVSGADMIRRITLMNLLLHSV